MYRTFVDSVKTALYVNVRTAVTRSITSQTTRTRVYAQFVSRSFIDRRVSLCFLICKVPLSWKVTNTNFQTFSRIRLSRCQFVPSIPRRDLFIVISVRIYTSFKFFHSICHVLFALQIQLVSSSAWQDRLVGWAVRSKTMQIRRLRPV